MPRLLVPRMVPPRGRVERQFAPTRLTDKPVKAVLDTDNAPVAFEDGTAHHPADHRIQSRAISAAG